MKMSNTQSVKELLHFIHMGARLDLKEKALDFILGLTGSQEGIQVLLDLPESLVSLVSLLDDNSESVSRTSSSCLVNISANHKGAVTLLNLDVEAYHRPLQKPPDNIVGTCLRLIFNRETDKALADSCCMILSNLTESPDLTEKVIEYLERSEYTVDDLVSVFEKTNHNRREAKLHFLGALLSNISCSSKVRRCILDKEKGVVQRLLPFTEYKESVVRRGGVVGTLRNCCFESELHEWLLGEDVDILPSLLLPLAGNEEFDEEDNDKLPPELQYLPQDKTRECDPSIRKMLLEAITQLCAKRCNREFIRSKNAYVILRELHKWEKDENVLTVCEDIVNILIRTEEEIGSDNLKEIQVPTDLEEKFQNIEKETIIQSEQE